MKPGLLIFLLIGKWFGLPNEQPYSLVQLIVLPKRREIRGEEEGCVHLSPPELGLESALCGLCRALAFPMARYGIISRLTPEMAAHDGKWREIIHLILPRATLVVVSARIDLARLASGRPASGDRRVS